MTLRVFVGEPSLLTSTQRSLSDRWHVRLFEAGCALCVVQRENYESDPWPGLRHRLEESDGALILGFTQLAIQRGTWRPETHEQAAVTSMWTSPWLQVEVGMAIALDLPVLLAADSAVGEGAFCAKVWAGNLYGTSLDYPDDQVVDEWLKAVAARHRCRVGGSLLGTFVKARPPRLGC